jgi:phenylalanyl-tRNA synthetase beta chain
MKIPVSWLGDFVDLHGLPIEEIARKLTLAGLEVTSITYAGLPMPIPASGEPHEFKTGGIGWDPGKIVVAEVREVKPHPNADRLTLLDLYDGKKNQTVLTGAPNIFDLRGRGPLPQPLKVAYAMEGAVLYDGHVDGQQLMTLKRTKIRDVESYSMVCSEKELGISGEHEGIILLDPDAPVGAALADYMGDAVLEIDILPNMARNASVIGVARELAALTGRRLIQPTIRYKTTGAPVTGAASVHIEEAELNPRFVLGLIRGVQLRPSPYQVQRRLRLAGMRPINCIVDATNYAMLELGQPLHAFDCGVLQARAGRRPIKIITRPARDGETLTTLDGTQRTLTAVNVLVCDQKGPLSIAGVMGGTESEVTAETRDVLLEGAAWNFINIRRTARQHNLPSEASFRFSRGVHPSLAGVGVQRGLQYMALWSGGAAAPGLVDQFPLKPKSRTITFTPSDVKRLLGIDLAPEEIVRLLEALEFKCAIQRKVAAGRGAAKSARKRPPPTDTSSRIVVTPPPHRLDIGEGVIGLTDIVEEIARLVGYDRIPSANIADALPPQHGNPVHEWEERLRDLLVSLGFDEVVSYRLTSEEREARLGLAGDHLRITNPVATDKSVLRRSLLASVLDSMERNTRWSESLAFFEIGPVFEPRGNDLPAEPRRLALAMTGLGHPPAWDVAQIPAFDFFDLKGRVELLLNGLGHDAVEFSPTASSAFLHPGKAAEMRIRGQWVGVMGELHPTAADRYGLGPSPVLAAEFDLDSLRKIMPADRIQPVPDFPPVLEDIAVIVDESVPASRVERLIREAGGARLGRVRLFDIYRGEQIAAGKKSLAYALTYQAADATLTDAEAAAVRNKIVQQLQQELSAVLRS